MESKLFSCEFCSNTFSSKYIVKQHQLNAKYCLLLQGKNATVIFPCYICNLEFSTKQNCQRHISKHTTLEIEQFEYIQNIKKTLEEENKELKLKIRELESKISTDNDIILKLEANIQRLERALERVALKPTNTHNTVNINNFIPLTNNLMLQNASKLTEKHMLEQDGEGYAKLAEDICKGNITCSDYARSILKWKNEDDMVTDPKGNKLWKLFCSGIRERNDEVFNELMPKVQLKMSLDPEKGFEEATRMADYRRDIRDGADGETSDLQRIVIERLCRLERV